jgi:hypothetical protein
MPANSQPVLVKFQRSGGALTRLTVSIWPSQGELTVPLDAISFINFKRATEQGALNVPPGKYRVVTIVEVIEAISGRFKYRCEVAGKERDKADGDINTTAGRDIEIFTNRFDLEVA